MTLVSVLEEEEWKMRGKRMNQEQVVVPVSHGQFVGAHGWRFMMVTLDAVECFTGQAVLSKCQMSVIFNHCQCLLKS